MLILQQHLTLVTTINTQGGEKKKKAIDRSAWLLLLHCFPGSLSAVAQLLHKPGWHWPQGCLQSSTRGEEGSRRAGRGKQLSSDIDSQLGSKTETQEQRAVRTAHPVLLPPLLLPLPPSSSGNTSRGGQDMSSREQQFCGSHLLFLRQDWP